MVEVGLQAAGFEPDPHVREAFTKYRKSHNDGVFDAYTPEIMSCRSPESLPVCPPTAVAESLAIIAALLFTASTVSSRSRGGARPDRRHVANRRGNHSARRTCGADRALDDLAAHGEALRMRHLPSRRADAHEAVQWTYFAYLGAIKEANGAAMSIGRISSLLRRLHRTRSRAEGTTFEKANQELIDQLVHQASDRAFPA